MDTQDNYWNSLSQREKADIIKVAINNGITTMSEIKQAYNKFAEGGPKRSYDNFATRLSKAWDGEDLSKHDYNYRKYYDDDPNRAYEQLESIEHGGKGHFPDGGESGTYKLPSHPTYPDLGDKSWSNNDTVFHISDRQLDGDTDRLLNYLGEDLNYNNGGTRVMYEDSTLLPSVQVVYKKDNPNFTEAYPGLVPNKYHTGWVYENSPARAAMFAYGGNLFKDGGKKKSTSNNTTAQRAMAYLMNKGMSSTGAAAIVGTLQAESSLDPTIHAQMKGDTGEGLAQWTGSRKNTFWKILEGIEPGARKRYGSISKVPFERQLDVVMAERPDVISAISNANNVNTATDIMLRGYENGGGTIGTLATKQQMDNIYGKWNNGYDKQMAKRLGNATNLLGLDMSTYQIPQTFFDDIDNQINLPQMQGSNDIDPETIYTPPTIDETLFQTPKQETTIEPVYNPQQERLDNIKKFNTVMGLLGQESPLAIAGNTSTPGLLSAIGSIYGK